MKNIRLFEWVVDSACGQTVKKGLMNEVKGEAKIRASKNPHPGIPDLGEI